ncbi:MAG: InlB B-repeat-containing protein, partial [Oscillospiraceae bacterium]|nr:InlB B-repeat-containing protein [Oscillospiraceae bacterium]
RTDSIEPAEIYAVQDEIRYDDAYMEIVEGSMLTASGITTKNIGLVTGGRALYMNYLSLAGGTEWQAETVIGTFQIVILGESGGSTMKSENCSVSTKDGSDSYAVSVNDLVVNIEGYCTATFDPQNGKKTWDVSVKEGEKLPEPEAPAKEGYSLTGWYVDRELTQKWDFENDVLDRNVTLYAGWTEGTTPANDDGADTPEAPSAPSGDQLRLWMIYGAGGVFVILLIFALLTGKKRKK